VFFLETALGFAIYSVLSPLESTPPRPRSNYNGLGLVRLPANATDISSAIFQYRFTPLLANFHPVSLSQVVITRHPLGVLTYGFLVTFFRIWLGVYFCRRFLTRRTFIRDPPPLFLEVDRSQPELFPFLSQYPSLQIIAEQSKWL